MAFKLGKESREYKSSKNTPIYKKKLDAGIKAEANSDGSIFVDHSVDLNSKKGQKIIAHEMQHIKDMKSGKAAYGEDYVRWSGTTYPRRDGKIQYKGKWHEEGDSSLPWEKAANKAEKNV
jgi:hypothetical protein